MTERFKFIFALICTSISLLGIEMVGARLLLPYLGSSMIQWAAIIGVVLTSYSIGYLLFNLIQKKTPFYSLILGSIFSLLSFLSLDFVSIYFLKFSLFFSSLLFSIFLMGVPSVLWATIFPKVLDKHICEQKYILILSTLGNLVGIWGITVLSIPTIGLNKSFYLVTVFPIISSLLFFDIKKLSHFLCILIYFVLTVYFFNHKKMDIALQGISFQETTPYQTYSITENEDEKSFYVEKYKQFSQSMLNSTDNYYYKSLSGLDFFPKNKPLNVLVIGIGGGLMLNYLKKINDRKLNLFSYELDEFVFSKSEKYFDFDFSSIDIKIGDARYLLNKEDKNFDYIILDTYIGSFLPGHLLTNEYFISLRSHLSKDGLIVMNLFSLYKETALYLKLLNSISLNFNFIYESENGLNNLIFISNKDYFMRKRLYSHEKRLSNYFSDDLNDSERLAFEVQKEVLKILSPL